MATLLFDGWLYLLHRANFPSHIVRYILGGVLTEQFWLQVSVAVSLVTGE
jgi:hypothetical protein